MAKTKEIEIEIDDETGEFRMETFCVEGGECTKMLDALQKALKADSIDTEDKPEKFRGEKNRVRTRSRN